MGGKMGVIRTTCALFACRVCRTKTNWPHQPWCELAGRTLPRCEDCRYYDRPKGRCIHPARRKNESGREGVRPSRQNRPIDL